MEDQIMNENQLLLSCIDFILNLIYDDTTEIKKKFHSCINIKKNF